MSAIEMSGPTPILAAVYRGNPDELAAALGGRPAPTVFEAAAMGDAARVRALATADRGAVDRRRPDGWPPLHDAAFRDDDVALINALLAQGAAADVRARDGRTALAFAEARGHRQVARRLRGEMA